MSSPELADRSHRLRGLGRRALVTSLLIPLLVVASVLIGGVLPSQGARGGGHPHQASTPASSTTTVPPVSTTTTAPPPTTTTTPPPPAPTTTVPAPSAAPSVSAEPSGYGCAAALAYLAAHAAPGFSFQCPGYADGNEAMTCVDHAPECAGERIIVIADPCPAAYMNEAYNSNSWSDATDSFAQGIDPYGVC